VTTATALSLHFVDTNVWLYALITGQDATKAQRAQALITQHTSIAVSTQVINEVCVNLIKREHFTPVQTRDVINDFLRRIYSVELDQTILVTATILREQYKLSYWDSLIVASALTSSAPILYSEDMHDGLIVDQRLTIINPFK
jgi:predicted nucleic acid-binding protein